MNLFHLKPAPLLFMFFWQTSSQPIASFTHFRYQRAVSLRSGSSSSQACAVVNADVFAHAASALKDLRLYSGAVEVPYTITVSEPPQQDTDEARILNLRSADRGRIVFDLEMPHRPYTAVVLDLAARDFIATAVVSGGAAPGGRNPTPLGSFTLFDLSSQHLSRSTTIPLSESTFPNLHIELTFIPAPSVGASYASLSLATAVKSATVPPSREAQSLYTDTQPPESLVQTGHDSVATFNVPARVPIESIAFSLPFGYKGDFSRGVKIKARRTIESDADDNSGLGDEDATGTILRVHRFEAGHDLSAEVLTIPVAVGSNMQQPALVEIHVEDTPDAPPPLSVELQMRQRRICFDMASANATLALYYGDPSLDAPAYTTAAFNETAAPRIARLEPEVLNSAFTATQLTHRTISQRPVLRWIALLGCVAIFALLVIRATHRRRR